MILEVLHIDACPNWIEAARRLEDALIVTGHGDTPVVCRLLDSSDEAAKVPFAGSPTITLDGQDLFESGGRAADLSCRVYFTPAGIAGLPTIEQLVDAIRSRENGHRP